MLPPELRIPVPGDPPDYDDTEAQDKAAKEVRQREERLRSVEAAILATPDGREWLWSILAATNVMGDRLILDNAYQNGFQNGEREIGLRLIRRLARTSPENFARMLTERDAG